MKNVPESKNHRIPPCAPSSSTGISSTAFLLRVNSSQSLLEQSFIIIFFPYIPNIIVLNSSYQHWGEKKRIYSTEGLVSTDQSQTLLLHNCSVPWKQIKYWMLWGLVSNGSSGLAGEGEQRTWTSKPACGRVSSDFKKNDTGVTSWKERQHSKPMSQATAKTVFYP